VAHTLILASRTNPSGAHVFNLPGAAIDQAGLIEAIESAIPGSSDLLSFAPVSLPFPSEIDHDGFESLGEVPLTPFAQGIGATVSILRSLADSGRLDPAEHGL